MIMGYKTRDRDCHGLLLPSFLLLITKTADASEDGDLVHDVSKKTRMKSMSGLRCWQAFNILCARLRHLRNGQRWPCTRTMVMTIISTKLKTLMSRKVPH